MVKSQLQMEPRCYILIASLSSLDTPLINEADREHSGTPTVVLHNDASLTILDISRLCVGARAGVLLLVDVRGYANPNL